MSTLAIQSALRIENSQRCKPPLPDGEVERIAESVARYPPSPDPLAGGLLSVNCPTKTGSTGASLPDGPLSSPIGGTTTTTPYVRQTAAALRATYTPTQWWVEGLIPIPGIVVMAGVPGIGKTWLNLSLALAAATGISWLDHFQTRQGRALLVMEEEEASSVLERLDKLYAGLGLTQSTGDALPIEYFIQQGVSLLTAENDLTPELLRHIQEMQPAIIVLDTFRRVHTLDENISKEMSLLFNRLRQLTRFTTNPCSIVLIHHMRKKGEYDEGLDRLRGSSDIAAAVDGVLEVNGQFPSMTVKHAKSKRGPSQNTFMIEADLAPSSVTLRFVEPTVKAANDKENLRGWVIETLRNIGPQNLSQLAKVGKEPKYGKDRIREICVALAEEGALHWEGGPNNSTVYSIPELSLLAPAPPDNNNRNP